MTDPSRPRKRPQSRRSVAWKPERPDPRGAAPALLSEVLMGTESFLAQRAGSAIPRAAWSSLVGRRIAGRTRVGRLFKGVLTVKVASSAWSNELSFLKPQLLSQIQRGGYDVMDLRFVVDRITDDSLEGAQAPKRRAAPRPRSSGETPLPDELVQRLKKVDDPNLRAAIAEAARTSMKKTSR